MECWRVALFKVKGKRVFGMANQSSSRIRLHRGDMGRSHNGVDLMPRFSFALCSETMEDRSVSKYVRAASNGCGSGARIVGFAHCNFLSSRK